MGRKSAKSNERRQRRREETAKYAASLAIVEAANNLKEPLSLVPPFRRYERNGIRVAIECRKVDALSEDLVTWAFELTKRNMEALYDRYQEGGWKGKDKYREMADGRAWYLIARDDARDGVPVGFVHFRFDMDYDDEVVYCYEIQIEEAVRRKGLGKFLMQILELLAFETRMTKVMLTVFKKNQAGQNLFVKTLKYEVDETCPDERVWEESCTYEILSKPVKASQTRGART